jgi:hypothetical protein
MLQATTLWAGRPPSGRPFRRTVVVTTVREIAFNKMVLPPGRRPDDHFGDKLHEFPQRALDDQNAQPLAAMQRFDELGKRLDFTAAKSGKRFVEQQQRVDRSQARGRSRAGADRQYVDEPFGLRPESEAAA